MVLVGSVYTFVVVVEVVVTDVEVLDSVFVVVVVVKIVVGASVTLGVLVFVKPGPIEPTLVLEWSSLNRRFG